MAKFKDKKRISKAAREKQKVKYKGTLIRLGALLMVTADFSREILRTRRKWQEIFQVMKSKGLQPILLHTETLSIKIEEYIRSFPDEKKRLKEYTSTKSALQDMLKGLL